MMNQEKQFVRELKDKQVVQTVFLAGEKMRLTDKNGKPYISVNLGDLTGSINARIWEKVDDFDRLFESGDFLWVKGHVQTYQNRMQIVVHEIQKAPTGGYDIRHFVKSAARPPEEMLKDLLEIVADIASPQIKTLTLNVLEDPSIRPLVLRAPAAKTIHHAYYGGLLEHILSIARLMQKISGHYAFLNADLLIFGAIFHDIGKIWELTSDASIDYSDRGRLVGHMALACELIDEKVADIPDFDPKLRDILKHIVLSHHGRLEYGSPIVPKFPEAMVVSMIDDFDSKLNTMMTFMNAEMSSGGDWSRYHQGFDSYLYLGIMKGTGIRS